jgi:hypothetical protein
MKTRQRRRVAVAALAVFLGAATYACENDNLDLPTITVSGYVESNGIDYPASDAAVDGQNVVTLPVSMDTAIPPGGAAVSFVATVTGATTGTWILNVRSSGALGLPGAVDGGVAIPFQANGSSPNVISVPLSILSPVGSAAIQASVATTSSELYFAVKIPESPPQALTIGSVDYLGELGVLTANCVTVCSRRAQGQVMASIVGTEGGLAASMLTLSPSNDASCPEGFPTQAFVEWTGAQAQTVWALSYPEAGIQATQVVSMVGTSITIGAEAGPVAWGSAFEGGVVSGDAGATQAQVAVLASVRLQRSAYLGVRSDGGMGCGKPIASDDAAPTAIAATPVTVLLPSGASMITPNPGRTDESGVLTFQFMVPAGVTSVLATLEVDGVATTTVTLAAN